MPSRFADREARAPVGAESKYETAMERAEAAIAKVRV